MAPTMLNSGEKFQVTIDLTAINNAATANVQKVGPNSYFSIEIKPPNGAVLNVERTAPPKIFEINNLN